PSRSPALLRSPWCHAPRRPCASARPAPRRRAWPAWRDPWAAGGSGRARRSPRRGHRDGRPGRRRYEGSASRLVLLGLVVGVGVDVGGIEIVDVLDVLV